MNTYMLEILTPRRQFFSGQVEGLIFPAPDGFYGVLAGHEPTVTMVDPGVLQFQVDGQWQRAAVTTGIVEIMPDYVILLVSAAEHPDEIDLKRAEEAMARAEERLRQQRSVQEYHACKAAIARATARLNTRT